MLCAGEIFIVEKVHQKSLTIDYMGRTSLLFDPILICFILNALQLTSVFIYYFSKTLKPKKASLPIPLPMTLPVEWGQPQSKHQKCYF